MNITLIITISIVVVLYSAVAMAYSAKVDDVLYYEYPKMSNKKKESVFILSFGSYFSINWKK